VRIAVGELKYQWSPGGFSISGRASQEVDFDDTTDLKAWSPIFPQKSAPFTFQDSTPHARSNRFFRIKLTP
jgi:hypothetical protein